MAMVERLTRVEAEITAMNSRANDTKEFFNDKIDEVIQSQARAEHDMLTVIEANKKEVGGKIDSTNSRLETTNELLNKINNKLSIHAFIFAAMSALGLTFVAAFAKSLLDGVMSWGK